MTQSFAYMLPERFMVVLTDFSFSNIIALGTRLKSRTFAAGSFPRNHEKSYRVTTNLLSCPYRCYCFSMASFPSSAYGWIASVSLKWNFVDCFEKRNLYATQANWNLAMRFRRKTDGDILQLIDTSTYQWPLRLSKWLLARTILL